MVADMKPKLLTIFKSSRQQPNRDLLVLSDFISQMDVTDTYKTFHTNTEQYTF